MADIFGLKDLEFQAEQAVLLEAEWAELDAALAVGTFILRAMNVDVAPAERRLSQLLAEEATTLETQIAAGTVPVVSRRHDGWTLARQMAFIDYLQESGCVLSSAQAVGKAVSGAYKMKQRAPAFSRAWDGALRYSALDLEHVAWDRALNGAEETVRAANGESVTRRRYNDRLLMFLLRAARPDRYGSDMMTVHGRGVFAERARVTAGTWAAHRPERESRAIGPE